MYYTALSDTHIFTKKRFFSGIEKSAEQVVTNFSPSNEERNKYKVFIPVDAKAVSFDLVLADSPDAFFNAYFVLRYANEPKDNYNSFDFIEGLCTVSLNGASYSYAPLPNISYSYEGIYFPEAVTRETNPINIGKLPYLREKDHLIQLRNPSINRTNIFHMCAFQGNVGIIQAGDWLYINIVSGRDYINDMILIMYL